MDNFFFFDQCIVLFKDICDKIPCIFITPAELRDLGMFLGRELRKANSKGQ
jgi:hypothetical protein